MTPRAHATGPARTPLRVGAPDHTAAHAASAHALASLLSRAPLLRRAPAILLALLALLANVPGATDFFLPSAAAAQSAPAPAAPNAPAPNSAALVGAVPAHRQADNVAIITIEGEIDRVLAESVERRIRLATRAGAQALVFEIHSPGGEIGAALRISSAIKNAPIQNTVAWINTEAISGAAIIALACREIITADSVKFGDAKPVRITMDGLTPRMVGLSRDEQRKILPLLVGDVLDSARRHNRFAGRYAYDEQLLSAIVADDVRLYWARHEPSGQTVALTPDEFALLFPDAPPPGPARLASARVSPDGPDAAPDPNAPGATQPRRGRNSREPGRSTPAPANAPLAPDAVAPEERFTPPSPALRDVAPDVDRSQTIPTARPAIRAQDRAQWTFLGLASEGTGPVLFTGDDLAFFNIAANVEPASGAGSAVPGATAAPNAPRQLRPIRTDADLTAFMGAKNLRRLDSTWSEGLVAFLTNPLVRGILIVVFLLALFIEMTSPGVALPGAIALAALLALIGPPFLIGMADWWEVAAILTGLLLIALELFVFPGFGIPGVLGVVALLAGLIATFAPGGSGLFPDSPSAQNSLLTGLVVVLLAFATAGVGVFFVAKHFGSLPLVGKLVLQNPDPDDRPEDMLATMAIDDARPRVGEVGAALTPLRPAGRAAFGERVLDVVSDTGFIPAGARVRVASVSEFRVGVEPATDDPTPRA